MGKKGGVWCSHGTTDGGDGVGLSGARCCCSERQHGESGARLTSAGHTDIPLTSYTPLLNRDTKNK